MNLVGMKKENLHLRVDAVISRPKEAQSYVMTYITFFTRLFINKLLFLCIKFYSISFMLVPSCPYELKRNRRKDKKNGYFNN